MLISLALSVDEKVIEVYDNKNVKLFCQDLIDITLKYDRYISQAKRYYLVFEVTIIGLKGYLLFIVFLYPHVMTWSPDLVT